MHYKPISSYGVIGDLHTVALVGRDGSIDFMCFPQFDSPSIFAALLDYKRGGSFQLAPLMKNARHKQLYLPDSNILLTRFLSESGMGEISDFMPICELGHAHDLVRRAKTIRGELPYRMVCAPRFDYGRAGHRIEKKKHEVLFISRGEDKTVLRLHSDVPLRVVNGDAIAEFTLRSRETAAFVLEDAGARGRSPSAAPHYVAESFKQTLDFWRRWLRHSQYRGRWREVVNRSALTLKLLTSAEYGSMVAGATFGLPEEIGGVRNWDYRYTWIRDASFTIYALMRLGYTAEAAAFMRWIEDRCNELKPGTPLQVMYRIDGSHNLEETELRHFEGYKSSRPVRIGNGAATQLQLDIYGELMDSVYIHNKSGELISYDFWLHLSQLIDWVCDNWQRPDEGIWEVRGGPYEFLHSRVMSWVALDRGIRLAQKRSFPAPLAKWMLLRDEIYRDVYQEFWDPGLKCFVQFKGARTVDASALLMPLVKFIGPNDPRWRSTLNVINEQLVEDSLVYRYNILKGANTGFRGREGTFSMCSFWNVECLARAGDVKLARFLFEKTLGYANHLGLYSEELGPDGEQLGNFPQAFTHLGLISAAYYLDRKLDEGE
ncbi:MAG TPA: glycoside hydrolase family 15 protein [Candidatus Binatia bacterium]|jgi:GH15 family glucan-1,4-alpha-glucosidase|nr:glycoside hydrolase family 15 protein [Candidatus Binatia bacterium]